MNNINPSQRCSTRWSSLSLRSALWDMSLWSMGRHPHQVTQSLKSLEPQLVFHGCPFALLQDTSIVACTVHCVDLDEVHETEVHCGVVFRCPLNYLSCHPDLVHCTLPFLNPHCASSSRSSTIKHHLRYIRRARASRTLRRQSPDSRDT